MASGASGAPVPRLVEEEHRQGPANVTNLDLQQAGKNARYLDQRRILRNVTHKVAHVSRSFFFLSRMKMA